MDLQPRVSLHSLCKSRLITTSSAAGASSIADAARVELTTTLHSADSRILHLKLAFQRCFTIYQINSINYVHLHLAAIYLIAQCFVNCLIFHFNSIESISFVIFKLCLISFS